MALTHSFFLISVFLLIVIASASYGDHSTNPSIGKSVREEKKLLSTLIAIQGLVYCKSAHVNIPLEGAVVRITCLADDEYGYEKAPVSFLSDATDSKGYFIATLSPYELQDHSRIKECKAFLELSPLETCRVATDVNNGINGAVLASCRVLPEKNMKLFTVGPFFYTSEDRSNSNY